VLIVNHKSWDPPQIIILQITNFNSQKFINIQHLLIDSEIVDEFDIDELRLA